jgi:hypothetical protein
MSAIVAAEQFEFASLPTEFATVGKLSSFCKGKLRWMLRPKKN